MIVKQRPAEFAFTIIELLIVMAIIIILAGLVLGISGYAHEKGARSRAEAEIAAMSAALENYKADNGIYPSDPSTQALDPTTKPDFSSYATASLYLYKTLSGSDEKRAPITGAKSYFAFKPNQLSPADGKSDIQAIRDPFGNSYGYSTKRSATGSGGYNPTYDLWSTGGETEAATAKWIKNW